MVVAVLATTAQPTTGIKRDPQPPSPAVWVSTVQPALSVVNDTIEPGLYLDKADSSCDSVPGNLPLGADSGLKLLAHPSRQQRTRAVNNKRRSLTARTLLQPRDPGNYQAVSAVDGLRANERIVSLLTGWRYQAMRQAREEGHSWSEIGAALNMSKQAAWESYKLSIESQELYVPEFFQPADSERYRAQLTDSVPADRPESMTAVRISRPPTPGAEPVRAGVGGGGRAAAGR